MSDYSAQIASALRAQGDNVHVWCPEFQGFTPAGLRKVGSLIDLCQQPRRLLVQWVPTGYGYRSLNIGFCRWLARRSAVKKDEIDLVIHEPGFGFWEGGLRHNLAAAVHRAMLVLLLRSATRVWGAAGAWEKRIQPYRLGRRVPFQWIPVPGAIPVSPLGPDADYAIGYFGHYDPAGIAALRQVLDLLPERIALIGRGAERVPPHERAIVIGEREPEHLSRAVASCRVMLHHYVDGVNGRRTTAMASLLHGKPVVTVEGRSTEPVWRGCVSLARVGDGPALASQIGRLLANRPQREQLAQAGAALYRERFALEHTVEKLRR